MRPGPSLRRHLSCVLAASFISACAGAPGAVEPAAAEVLTLAEAARFLRVEPAALAEMALRNEVPARRINEAWRFSRTALQDWLRADRGTMPSAAAPTAVAKATGRGTKLTQGDAPPARGDEASNEPIGEAPKQRPADEVFLRAEKVLLAPGEVTLDVGQFYSKADDRRLVQVGAGVGLGTVETQAFTTSIQARIGVLKETQLSVGTSYQKQESDVFFGSTPISESSRSEFGDVVLGLSRTVLHEGSGIPNVIVALNGHVPTGDTSYALGGGLALVKSVDPVVLFGSINYRHTFSRDFADVTRLEPEERLDASLGYALALNDTLTISMALSGLFTAATRFDNATLRQTERFSLQLGLTSWLGKGLYIEPTVSIGLSGPGNSLALGVTLPYTF
jgi:Helix-turn-helix domain